MPFAIDYDNGSFAVINAVGGPIVSAGYIILIVYLCQSVHGAQIMRIFKYPGKLSYRFILLKVSCLHLFLWALA